MEAAAVLYFLRKGAKLHFYSLGTSMGRARLLPKLLIQEFTLRIHQRNRLSWMLRQGYVSIDMIAAENRIAEHIDQMPGHHSARGKNLRASFFEFSVNSIDISVITVYNIYIQI